jgi:hypothetical protein
MKSAAALAKARSNRVNPDIPAFHKHHSRAELAAIGKALRDKCPRVSHAERKPPKDPGFWGRLVLDAGSNLCASA